MKSSYKKRGRNEIVFSQKLTGQRQTFTRKFFGPKWPDFWKNTKRDAHNYFGKNMLRLLFMTILKTDYYMMYCGKLVEDLIK